MKKKLALIVAYVCLWMFTYSSLFAYLNAHSVHLLGAERANTEAYRSDMALAAGMVCLTPLSLPAAIFLTGFCEHGFKFK